MSRRRRRERGFRLSQEVWRFPVNRYPDGYVPVGYDTGRETIVQQQFMDEVDINTIVRRFGLTREMPSGVEGGVYGDFTGISDYESALAAVERAQEGFMTLSPEVREKFANDPGEYLAHVAGMSDEELELASGRAPVVAPVIEAGSEGSSLAATRVASDGVATPVHPDVAVGAERHVRRRKDA